MDDLAFRKMMESDEARKLKVYPDSRGKWSIGIGRNLVDKGISDVECDFLFSNDVQEVKADLNKYISWWMGLSNNRQMVLANIAMNGGSHGLLKYVNMLAAAKAENFTLAAAEIRNSDSYRSELKDRYERLAVLMEKG